MKSKWLSLLGRLLIGGLFVAAGGLKIIDPKSFARAIVDYQLVPSALVPLSAVLIPWWETVAGALVIAGWRWRTGALAVLTLLSAIFVGATCITLLRGLSPTCGCFGMLSERVGPMSLLLELGVLLLSASLLRAELRGEPGKAGSSSV